MRKFLAIVALTSVGVLTILLMPKSAYGATATVPEINSDFYITNLTDYCTAFFTLEIHAYVGTNTSGSLLPSPFSKNISCETITDTSYSIAWAFGTTSPIYFTFTSLGFDFYYQFNASDYSFLTRFITVVPSYGSTTATTTLVGSTLYISPDDWVDGTYLHMRFVNNTLQNGIGGSALDAWNAAFGGINISLVSGFNDVSTSTTFTLNGQVNWDLAIKQPNDTFLIGGFLPDQTIISTSSLFYVNRPTALDIAMASSADVLITGLLTGTTTGQSILRCNPIGFDFTVCLISLFIPNRASIKAQLETFRDTVLTSFPLGYVTRFIEIAGSDETIAIPSISYTVGSTSPFYSTFNGDPIEFDPFGALANPDSPLNYLSDQSEQKSLRDIMEVPITILINLTLLFMIIKDLTGSHSHGTEFNSDTTITPEVRPGGRPTGIVHRSTRITRRKL